MVLNATPQAAIIIGAEQAGCEHHQFSCWRIRRNQREASVEPMSCVLAKAGRQCSSRSHSKTNHRQSDRQQHLSLRPSDARYTCPTSAAAQITQRTELKTGFCELSQALCDVARSCGTSHTTANDSCRRIRPAVMCVSRKPVPTMSRVD